MFGTRVVVCAAVRFPDGVMLVGPRHYDKVMQIQFNRFYIGASNIPNEKDGECGFLDQKGDFMTREEAYEVAKKAKQFLDPNLPGPKLFSEDIYEDHR